MLYFDVAVLYPSERLESFSKGSNAGLCFGIVLGEPMQEYDAPHLCARRDRPRRRRAAQKRDELATSHCLPALGPHQKMVFNPSHQSRKLRLVKWGRAACALQEIRSHGCR